MDQHLDEDAELYALGLTEPERSAAIEAHLEYCEPCRACVIAAEAAAASLAAALPAEPAGARADAVAARPPRVSAFAVLAAAAAIVLAATATYEGVALHGSGVRLAQTDIALGTIAGSHFNHTSLSARPGIVAKVLYARDGAWLYVIAENAGPAAHVVVEQGGVERDLGPLGAGNPGTLFARTGGRFARVRLVRGGATLAEGTPQY